MDKKDHIYHIMDIWKKTGKTFALTADGDSMYPTIQRGDKIVLSATEPSQLKTGDIFAFFRNGSLVVHRLLWKKNASNYPLLLEKGDNRFEIGQVANDQVLGKVLMIKRKENIVYTNPNHKSLKYRLPFLITVPVVMFYLILFRINHKFFKQKNRTAKRKLKQLLNRLELFCYRSFFLSL
jgi:signal peptidase I